MEQIVITRSIQETLYYKTNNADYLEKRGRTNTRRTLARAKRARRNHKNKNKRQDHKYRGSLARNN